MLCSVVAARWWLDDSAASVAPRMLGGFQVTRLDTHDVHDQDRNCLVLVEIRL